MDTNDAHSPAHLHRKNGCSVRRLIGMGGGQFLRAAICVEHTPTGQRLTERLRIVFAKDYLAHLRLILGARVRDLAG